jgi:hypothetical protein
MSVGMCAHMQSLDFYSEQSNVSSWLFMCFFELSLSAFHLSDFVNTIGEYNGQP